MLEEGSAVVVLSRSGQKADFGSAFYTTMCPECQKYLKWRPSLTEHDLPEPGIMTATCCRRAYEMYTEDVTIKQVSGSPMPKVNAHRRSHSKYVKSQTLADVDASLSAMETV